MAASCVFCSIIGGGAEGADAHFVLDTPDVVAFLDHRPLFPGHTLVMPREHVPTLRDLPGALRDELFAWTQSVAAAVQDAMGAQGSFVAMNNVVSQSVPHIHFHIVPRWKDDRLFSQKMVWRRVSYRDEAEKEAVAERIRKELG